jgi:LysR substrate binding domain
MNPTAALPTASSIRPGRPTAPGTGPSRYAAGKRQPPDAMPRPRTGGKVLRTAVPAALVAATFGFALPHLASYHSVWASMQAMTWPQALLVAAAAATSMASYWFMICAVLPSIRLRQAAAVNLSCNAVANTLPAGGALALGVSWAMLSSWGVSAADYALYTLVSVLVPSGHRFAGLDNIPAAVLAEEPLLLAEEAQAPEFNQFTVEMCRAAGFTPTVYGGTVESIRAAADLVAQGRCLYCVPSSCIAALPGTIWRPLTEPASYYPWSVLWRAAETSGHVRAVVSCARAMSQRLGWLATAGQVAH